MADSIWGTGRRLDESLFGKAYEFEFFQAVRLLALMDIETSREADGRRPTGAGAMKACERLRFGVHTSMAFPASPVFDIEAGLDSSPHRMTVTFLGLIGPFGVLPESYTESAIHQKAFGDPSFAAFFDIFHHRLLCLFYRAWEKHHFFVGYEQANRGNAARDALSGYLFTLIGMGTTGLEKRLPFPDHALLRYAGLLAQRPRSAECLRALLNDFFAVPAAVEQFLGRWHPLDLDELCAIGVDRQSSQLGEGAVAGEMVWSRQSVIRISFGPLTAIDFFEFLPSGAIFRKAVGLIRWFLGPVIDFEIQPLLAGGEAPDWCCLGDARMGGPRLGWCSWLTDEPFERPASEAIFAEGECVAGEVEYAA
jgi:type VI secretion system protein ImpH